MRTKCRRIRLESSPILSTDVRLRKEEKMKRIVLITSSLVLAVIVSGCATGVAYRSASADALAAMPPQTESADQSRMLIWRAWLSLEVASVSNAVTHVTDIAKESGGYVETQSDSGGERANVTLRVPVDSLKTAMSSLEAIGKVTSRRVSSEDVTEQYVDIDARLKTMVALRDRLRALLDKAQDVKDVLAIEKELSRVQADIDSMQARLKALKGKVDLASVSVSIKRRRILGPLGYVLKGAWWTVEKLFVIQE
jgi:hypothetical protein